MAMSTQLFTSFNPMSCAKRLRSLLFPSFSEVTYGSARGICSHAKAPKSLRWRKSCRRRPQTSPEDQTPQTEGQEARRLRRGLYVHVILSDTRFGVGLGPLCELVLTFSEVDAHASMGSEALIHGRCWT